MSSATPEKWICKRLAELGTFTKGKGIAKKDTLEEGIPCIRYAEIYTDYDFLISSFKSFISRETADSSKRLSKNDIIFAGSGETVDEIGKSVAFTLDCEAYVGGDAVVFSPKKGLLDGAFLSFQLNDEVRRLQLRKLGQGSSVIHIYSSGLQDVSVSLPPLPEQKKIASILTSVNEVIENTQKQIDKLQDLKKATMNELLTKGIGHTEFKDSDLGRIPKGWATRRYGDLVNVEMPKIKLDDSTLYAPVVVRRRHKGVETRGEKLGSQILVKTQYSAKPNTFLISKRQIFHKSCGIVPSTIAGNAIISKEYLALSTCADLDIRFLNYFSRTQQFQNQIIKTTYGVDEEKFVFKDDWWMRESIILPSIEEQKEICDAVDAIEKSLSNIRDRLAHFQSLKKALMQDLLTGKVRVSVD